MACFRLKILQAVVSGCDPDTPFAIRQHSVDIVIDQRFVGLKIVGFGIEVIQSVGSSRHPYRAILIFLNAFHHLVITGQTVWNCRQHVAVERVGFPAVAAYDTSSAYPQILVPVFIEASHEIISQTCGVVASLVNIEGDSVEPVQSTVGTYP